MFSLLVSDCVYSDVLVEPDVNGEILTEKEMATVSEIGELCRLVRPVTSFRDLVITVE